MKRLLSITLPLLALFAIPATAQSAVCMGKKAKTISKSGFLKVDRYDVVMLTGKRVNVKAEGDNRICSTRGDVKLTFGKGMKNMASLGKGDDKVVISHKAVSNIIRLGDGNNSIKFKNKAVTHSVTGGSGRDKVLFAYKTSNALVDTGGGDDTVTLASKATRQKIKTGTGDDRITIREPAKTDNRLLKAGLGNDNVNIIAKGHTTTYLSETSNPRGLPDTDTFSGGPSNDTVYDYFGGSAANPNLLLGNRGFDKLNSLGTARTDIYGGDGTDWLYAASDGENGDRIFGERGNDKLFADRGDASAKGAFLDAGEGDDWIYGTAGNDTIVALSGIKKVYGNAGDDMMIKTGNGIGTIEGGGGFDTISYIAHTPPGFGKLSGVMVDFSDNTGMNGKGVDTIHDVEHLIGSPFDDELTGSPSVANQIDGGIGNDEIVADSRDEIDGGLGVNDCTGGKQVNCNRSSPGEPSSRQTVIDIGQEGILTVLGSTLADKVNVGYDMIGAAYIVDVDRPALASRDCDSTNTPDRYRCPAPRNVMSTLTVESGGGNDDVTIDYSVPSDINSIINTGDGNDTVTGGKTKDFVTLAENVSGRDGNDMLNPTPGSNLDAGDGSDTLHVENPCFGGSISGGPGKDGVVFAGAPYGVEASLKGGYAKWNGRGCDNAISMSKDLEGLEGSSNNDILIGQAHGKGKTSFLGRDGIDTFYAKNGNKDTVTTGGGGHKNKVYADRVDKVIWGWGLAAY